jgi:putative endonuclease
MFQKIMFFYVYVLQSNIDRRLYIGSTDNLINRVEEHNLGLSVSTRRYTPWTLIYYEACRSLEDAKRREKYLKTSQGGRLIRSRLKEYLFRRRFA